MPLLEPSFYGLWGAKQTARGTPAASSTRRFIQVAGNLTASRDDGSENWSDLSKYGSDTDWVNSVAGAGEPGIESTPDELAWLLWVFHGGEVVTAQTGPPTAQRHTFTPSVGRGHYATFWRRVGQSVVQRHRFDDCLITRVVMEGSTANKAVRVTPRILSLDPGKVQTVDQATAVPTDKTFLYTDGTGSFTIDGVVFNGQSQWTLTIDDAWEALYADDVIAFDVQQGTPVVTLGVTAYMDAVALAQWNKMVYGSASPAAGTAPLKRVPALGSYQSVLTQRDQAGALTGRRLATNVPGVKWTIPEAPAPNPDGGPTEIALTGSMRPTSPFNPATGLYTGAPPYTIDVDTANGTTAFTG